eukprot:6806931-Alexandrium_andersonii.AAC.1
MQTETATLTLHCGLQPTWTEGALLFAPSTQRRSTCAIHGAAEAEWGRGLAIPAARHSPLASAM